ncbi:NAD(P)/FAD-dependent oxidoreductase [Pseudomonas sp. 5P_3.1_Bac2]|uniref:NAD(P)/FAD-dependent oxidoreductase n=1 Tax=Pseudomonas sp. 5P_3.1_Bac2 TaxID=2971617 RepID=UPI0021C7ED20|nr:NAD(P)/FAD-dependent oxidoreductase [Pseudomonas sp. 5P_3.1_Bac2]MCU1717405.1 NAD(P)/FAD-dependent oxidoreductase [Pseudomonas sp. 5P_3.1_Bac2]
MPNLTRRHLLTGLSLLPWLLPSTVQANIGRARVVVVGGGFAGATAARYLKRQAPELEVLLVEPKTQFYTCPFSNHVLAGLQPLNSLRQSYQRLQHAGIRHIRQSAAHIDLAKNRLLLSNGEVLPYDRLLLACGISMNWQALPGYDQAAAQLLPHAWQAGAQTALLHRQLQAMDDGGVVLISVPDNPYRCPPGPYERASLIAHYLSLHKPRSKLLILDSKDSFSKQALFQQSWQQLHAQRIEWLSRAEGGRVVEVDARRRTLICEFGQRHQGNVVNLIPPQQAADIARQAGLVDRSGWVPIHAASFQSQVHPKVYAIGDCCIAAPMPKSAYSANAQAKVAVAALLADLAGSAPAAAPLRNTCYSALAPGRAVSIAANYELQHQRLAEVAGSLSLSPLDGNAQLRAKEAVMAEAWYHSITADAWG